MRVRNPSVSTDPAKPNTIIKKSGKKTKSMPKYNKLKVYKRLAKKGGNYLESEILFRTRNKASDHIGSGTEKPLKIQNNNNKNSITEEGQ